MDILDIVKLKLKGTTITEPEMELAIEEVSEVVKNYCNRDDVPSELNFTVANMAIDLLKYTSPESGDSDVSTSDVSSIRMGDMTINLRSRSHVAKLDELTMDYKGQLNKFRRLV